MLRTATCRTLEITLFSGSTASVRQVAVRSKASPEQRLTIKDKRKGDPDPGDLARIARDREITEDLFQETFIKVLNAIDSYRPEFKFSSWIFKIANNAAIDHLRRRSTTSRSRPPPAWPSAR